MVQLTVNDRRMSVKAGSTVIQACEAAGVDMPRFCYHERLGVAGNCRRCLVEMEKSPKPVASCARPVRAGRVVFTDTPQVRKAREAVREFLLRNHPLDCPMCDQGGECDLQDQARVFGSDRSRYTADRKRSVEDKNWGPLVKTVRTRCMQCTRCVRFASEVAGVSDLGATGRGRQVEMGTYVNRPFLSELSANVMDLCPVGALTSQGAKGPFTFRPWELTSTDSYDLMDPRRLPVRVQTRGLDLRRMLPRTDEWLGDKSRYAPVDHTQRLRASFMEGKAVNRTTASAHRASLLTGSSGVRRVVSPTRDRETVGAIAATVQAFGASLSLEALVTATESNLMESTGLSLLPRSVADSLDTARSILLVHYNPRLRAPVLNARMRRAYLSGADMYTVGEARDLGYPVKHLGLSLDSLDTRHVAWTSRMASNPVTLVTAKAAPRLSALAGSTSWKASSYIVPVRANEAIYWDAPFQSLATPTAPLLTLLVGVTETECAALGYNLHTDILAHAKPAVVFHHVGAAWRDHASVNRMMALPSPREKATSWRNRFGERMATKAALSPAAVTTDTPNVRGPRDRIAWAHAVRALRPTSVKPAKPAQPRSAQRTHLRPIPLVRDYHLEGHARAETSPTRAKASAYRRAYDSNFSQ